MTFLSLVMVMSQHTRCCIIPTVWCLYTKEVWLPEGTGAREGTTATDRDIFQFLLWTSRLYQWDKTHQWWC